jgi:hypothetical protein
MLTDSKLKALKPKAKIYKVADRDGIYVTVSPTGGISFRLDYRLNGRRESLTLGRYGSDGTTLVRARELAMASLTLSASGVLLARRKPIGAALYLLVFAATIIWVNARQTVVAARHNRDFRGALCGFRVPEIDG